MEPSTTLETRSIRTTRTLSPLNPKLGGPHIVKEFPLSNLEKYKWYSPHLILNFYDGISETHDTERTEYRLDFLTTTTGLRSDSIQNTLTRVRVGPHSYYWRKDRRPEPWGTGEGEGRNGKTTKPVNTTRVKVIGHISWTRLKRRDGDVEAVTYVGINKD